MLLFPNFSKTLFMRVLFTMMLIGVSLWGHSQFCFVPPQIEENFNQSMKLVKPSHAGWIRSTGQKVQSGKLEVANLRAEVSNYAVLGNLNNADIEALSFLVLMQAAKSAQEDLKQIMENIKSINQAKARQREALKSLSGNRIKYNTQLDSLKRVAGITKANARPVPAVALKTLSKEELDDASSEIKKEMDTQSDMAEELSIRLQMHMDRLTKAYSMISNMLKKFGDTTGQITENLK